MSELVSDVLFFIGGIALGLAIRDYRPDFLRFYFCRKHGWVYHTKELQHRMEQHPTS